MPSSSFVQFSITNHAILFSYYKSRSYMKKLFFPPKILQLSIIFVYRHV